MPSAARRDRPDAAAPCVAEHHDRLGDHRGGELELPGLRAAAGRTELGHHAEPRGAAVHGDDSADWRCGRGWPLTLVVYCLNMVGYALRDLLDPRLRGGGGALAGGVGTRAAERATKALQKLERSRCCRPPGLLASHRAPMLRWRRIQERTAPSSGEMRAARPSMVARADLINRVEVRRGSTPITATPKCVLRSGAWSSPTLGIGNWTFDRSVFAFDTLYMPADGLHRGTWLTSSADAGSAHLSIQAPRRRLPARQGSRSTVPCSTAHDVEYTWQLLNGLERR